MTSPPGLEPDLSSTGRPADIRVSKTMRHRLAGALSTATGMSFATARAIVAQRAGDSVDDLEAWLRATYRLDPTGVTAVRNVLRGGRA
jgi:hypothetical protein